MSASSYPTDTLRVLSSLSRTDHTLRLSEAAAPAFLAREQVARFSGDLFCKHSELNQFFD